MECKFIMKFSRKWKIQTAAIIRIRFKPAYPVKIFD